MFGKADAYLNRYAPRPPEVGPPPDAPASSLPPAQFVQLFGEGAEGLLQDVLEGDEWTPAQRVLAMDILNGDRSISELQGEDRAVLDEISQQLAHAPAQRKEPEAPKVVRPSWIATQNEMESFPNEYHPHPSQRDWPMSPDDPEGEQ